MPRPSLNENPVYRETRARLIPVNKIMDEAKAECELIMKMAKRKVEHETLDALAYGVSNGLSQYAISTLTGKTRASDRREVFARVEKWIEERSTQNA